MGYYKISACGLLVLLICALGIQCAEADSLKCLTCHSAPGFRKVTEGERISLHVDAEEIASSVHASKNCLDCHTDFRGQPFPHKQKADPVKCVTCHHKGNTNGAPDKTHIGEFVESVHGSAVARGDKDAPTCADCHGKHNIRSPQDPKSLTYQTNIPETCGKCHFGDTVANRHGFSGVELYSNSVHARIIRKDRLVTAAVCTDCHGIHDILPPGDVAATTHKTHVPATCGKCHQAIYQQYKASVHGRALAAGEKEAPVCTDCHGEHGTKPKSSAESSVYPTHVVTTCSKCHEDLAIQNRYGLPAHRLSTYVGSYHGIASKYGDITVANCSTCHGAHKILASTDPKSPVHKNNLPSTCGKCHPNAGENFAKGTIHILPSQSEDAIVYWVRLAYTLFIVLLIGSFCGYIVLDLIARWRGKIPWRRKGNH